MIRPYHKIGRTLTIFGLVAQSLGILFLTFPKISPGAATDLLLEWFWIPSTVVLLTGLAFYAKAKRRNPWLSLLAFLSVIGVAVLVAMHDRSDPEELK